MMRAYIAIPRIAEMQASGWTIIDGPEREGAVLMEGPELPDTGWTPIGDALARVLGRNESDAA